MADLPSASVAVDTSGALATLGDYFLVAGCTPLGSTLAPQIFGSGKALLTSVGDCRLTDEAAAFLRKVNKPIVFVGLPVNAAGTVANVNVLGVTGSSVITAAPSGALIFDEIDFVFKVIAGGTIATAGITFQYSLDGGQTFSPTKALGTASTYAVPRCGFTLSFAAGTLAAGDKMTCFTIPAKWNGATAPAALFAALLAQNKLFRGGLIIGECTASDAANWQSALATFEANGRPMWLILECRDRYHSASMGAGTATFAASGHTITRGTGDFAADGFKVGMTVTVASSASNNGSQGKITAVGTTVLTFAAGLTNETLTVDATHGSITGAELDVDWTNQMGTDMAAVLYDDPRISIVGGRAFYQSDVLGSDFGALRRFPWALAEAIREMQFGPQIMTSKVENGPVTDFSIVDVNGVTIEHDDRTSPGLTLNGIGGARSFDQLPGAYSTLPLMRATNPNSGFSRRPIVSVMGIFCQVVQKATQQKLSAEVIKNADGTISEKDARRIENYVNSQLAKVLLGVNNRLASAASWTMSRRDNLNTPGAIVNGDGELNSLGYLEQFKTKSRLVTT